MNYPARLTPNQVSIYGGQSINGFTTSGDMYQFGLVDQRWDGMDGTVSSGQSVMFNRNKSVQIFYDNNPYFIVQESDIILIETPAP